MKAFITGSTGFIGSFVVQRLSQTEHELHCLVRKGSNTNLLEKVGAKQVEGDITDKGSLLQGMRGCDWVINIAAAYEFWLPRKDVYHQVNVEGTRNVMECALECEVSKVVHVSTAVIYGKPAPSPFTEESPVGPVRFSRYAQTKYEGDLIAWDLYEKQGLPLVVIYPGGVLGSCDPKTTGQYILRLINRRLPATVFPDVIFPWIHVKDVAEAIVSAAEKEGNIGEKYLVVSENLTFGEINQMISEISGVPLPRLRMPDFLAMINAGLLTMLANVTKKPPIWGMALDQIRTMKEGARVDGSKTSNELGVTYTPIRSAIEDAVTSYRDPVTGSFIRTIK